MTEQDRGLLGAVKKIVNPPLPEPAQRVYITDDGRLLFWFTASVVFADAPGPLLSRYDLDTDDAGWLYTYVGEERPA